MTILDCLVIILAIAVIYFLGTMAGIEYALKDIALELKKLNSRNNTK